MKNKLMMLLAMSFFLHVKAQKNYYNQSYKEEMQLLEKMVGDWKGSGWVINKESHVKETFSQTEKIRYALDSTSILVEGKGTAEGKIIHDALAVIFPNDSGGYFFHSFLGNGLSGKYKAKLVGEKLIWMIPVETGMIMYTIVIDGDHWLEKGAFGTNDQWHPFLEMQLKRIMK